MLYTLVLSKFLLTALILLTRDYMFSVSPVAQPVVGEMEIHSVANLATLQTPLATFPP